jgi:Ricin-type beta-trefoil lectin domain
LHRIILLATGHATTRKLATIDKGTLVSKRFLCLAVSLVALVASTLFCSQSPAAAAGVLHGPYQVLGIQSSKCIDVPNGAPGNNVTLEIYTCQNPATQNQLFWAEDHGGGDWEIWNTGNGKCLTVKGASTADNAAVIQYDCTLGSNEVWALAANYTIVNKKSNKCLTVKNNGTTNGSTLLQFKCNGGKNQIWSWSTQW